MVSEASFLVLAWVETPNLLKSQNPDSEPEPPETNADWKRGGGELAACSMKANLLMVNKYNIYFRNMTESRHWKGGHHNIRKH